MSRKNNRNRRNQRSRRSHKTQAQTPKSYTAKSSNPQVSNRSKKQKHKYVRAINPAAVNAIAVEIFGGLSYQTAKEG